MKPITENEAYLLGLLYGKGTIHPVDKGKVQLEFRIKFRRPTNKKTRVDNIHTIINDEDYEYEESLRSKLLEDFSTVVELLKDTWNLRSEYYLPEYYTANDWHMKKIALTTEPIDEKNERLTELLKVEKLSSDSLCSFPFHLNLENSKVMSLAFIQGICDSCSLVPNEASGDHGGEGEPRVQLEPPQERWELPIGMCQLFQIGLNIPVNNINWGHPQIRGEHSWKYQNHQFRVSLKHIPPHIDLYRSHYKREEYKHLYQRKCDGYEKEELCPKNRRFQKGTIFQVETSKDENLNSDLLDERIRGIDLKYKGKKSILICKLLGCTQCLDAYHIKIDEEKIE